MFKVDGWNVNSKSIAKDASSNKQKKSKNNKKVHEQKQREKFKHKNTSFKDDDKEVSRILNNTSKDKKRVDKDNHSTPKQEKVTTEIIQQVEGIKIQMDQ